MFGSWVAELGAGLILLVCGILAWFCLYRALRRVPVPWVLRQDTALEVAMVTCMAAMVFGVAYVIHAVATPILH